MERQHVAHLGPITPDEDAKVVQEHPAVIPRLLFTVVDMWTADRIKEQKNRQDALRLSFERGK